MGEMFFDQSTFEYCPHSSFLLNKLYLQNKKSPHKIDMLEIKKAIYYTKKYHGTQKRKSGEPYYTHPIEVANIASDYMFDRDLIIAALLHDVIEDTDVSLNQIELIFGSEVAKIVDGVTNIKCNFLLSKEEFFYKIARFNTTKKSTNLNKKIMLIKTIDRLHNMRTIKYLDSIDKQKKLAKETLHFYIHLARCAKLDLIAMELQFIAISTLNS